RELLRHRWGAVRPMAQVAELLAVFAGAFSMQAPLAEHRPCPNDNRQVACASGIGQAPGCANPKVGVQRFTRQLVRVGTFGQGPVGYCRWCGMSIRTNSRACWSCGLPPDPASQSRQVVTAAT